jgi:hypothetical protein
LGYKTALAGLITVRASTKTAPTVQELIFQFHIISFWNRFESFINLKTASAVLEPDSPAAG